MAGDDIARRVQYNEYNEFHSEVLERYALKQSVEEVKGLCKTKASWDELRQVGEECERAGAFAARLKEELDGLSER